MRMLHKKTWDYFRSNGILFFINKILHFFGWVIVVEVDKNESTKEVYPVKCRYKKTEQKNIERGHRRIAKYLSKISDKLKENIHNEK